jgi:hypothetical protein
MKNRKVRNWFKNEWIGKATLAGLNEAMEDLDYTWGTHVNEGNRGRTLQLVKNENIHKVKLAA